MPDTDRLAARLDAVERALTDGDHELDSLPDAAALSARVDELDARTTELESGLADLEAAVRALRGYVGNVDAVNEAVERRADAALAAAERTATHESRRESLPDELDADGSAGWRDAGATEQPAAGSEAAPDDPDVESDEHSTVAAGEQPRDSVTPDHERHRAGDPVGDDRPGHADATSPDGARSSPDGGREGWTEGGADRWLDRHDGACPTCGGAPAPESESDGSRDSADRDFDPEAPHGSDDDSLLARLGEVL